MSLSNINRISCTLFHGSCACKPALRMAMYCKPTSFPVTARVARAANRASLSTTRMFATEPERQTPVEVSFKDKVTGMWKNYGKLAIGTYLCIYVGTLSSLFMALDYHVFNAATFGFDPLQAIDKVCDIYEGVTGSASLPEYIRENPRVGTFAVAWVMCKFTEPLRLATTVAIVPSVSRLIDTLPIVGKPSEKK
ncbi:hypothetical protein B484DRAFT_434847 [Ochromonadaceae sp. CCMP2298]|nr:hypothetical protein B484DRAFT_434847 [Ochromonadaceae sp. CCMP2298]